MRTIDAHSGLYVLTLEIGYADIMYILFSETIILLIGKEKLKIKGRPCTNPSTKKKRYDLLPADKQVGEPSSEGEPAGRHPPRLPFTTHSSSRTGTDTFHVSRVHLSTYPPIHLGADGGRRENEKK